MAHPKRKISKQRRNTRRSVQKITPQKLVKCASTGEIHIYHQAYWVETEESKQLHYRGKILMEKKLIRKEKEDQ